MKTTLSSSAVFENNESNVRSYCRQFDCVVERARGAELWDVHGTRYLDFLAGAGSLNYGHNNPVLKSALVSYIDSDGITHGLDLMTSAKASFLSAFRTHILEPRHLDYVLQFTGPTGTNAVESAFKVARKVTGRTNIVSFTNGFHGVSVGALAATGNRYLRGGAAMPLGGVSVMPYDGYLPGGADSIEYLETMLDDPSSGLDLPAAVVVECIQGEGGLKAASSEWLQRLADVCKRFDVLLIVDDIQAGCGRSGQFFSFEQAGITPDIVTLSKSLSGMGLPMALCMMRRELDVWKPGEHNGTFRGNNHAFVTATAAINEYWRTNEFAVAVAARGARLHDRLEEICARYASHISEVRGRGMMLGLNCTDPEQAAAVTAQAFQRGLILERSGPRDEVIKFLTPLTIEEAHLVEGLDILESSLQAVHGQPVACRQIAAS